MCRLAHLVLELFWSHLRRVGRDLILVYCTATAVVPLGVMHHCCKACTTKQGRVYRMLIGACDPMLCPTRLFRTMRRRHRVIATTAPRTMYGQQLRLNHFSLFLIISHALSSSSSSFIPPHTRTVCGALLHYTCKCPCSFGC